MRAFWRRRTHEDFSDEVQAHLDLETERLIGDGTSPEAARSAARKSFGNVVAVKERFYEASRWTWLEQLSQDLRYGSRGLVKSPSFLATSVLTLAVGLGLVTVAFTIFNAYVLRPFAVRRPVGAAPPRLARAGRRRAVLPVARLRGTAGAPRSVRRVRRRGHALRVVERPAARDGASSPTTTSRRWVRASCSDAR